MNTTQSDSIKEQVRRRYARIGAADQAGCGCSPSCCGGAEEQAAGASARMGYSPVELTSVPEGADLGLGCGNPQAIAALQPGEVVLDLGSGGGLDCFLAARQVGEGGRVIGVDMTPEMVSRARRNAERGGIDNVEFRLGEIENLPVADRSVDVIMSNCVINLSPDKQRVFDEAFRALKPGGRLAVSDVVALAELPAEMRADPDLNAGCVSGASRVEEVQAMLERAGFSGIRVEVKEESAEFIRGWAPDYPVEDFIRSAYIQAIKP